MDQSDCWGEAQRLFADLCESNQRLAVLTLELVHELVHSENSVDSLQNEQE